MMTRAVHGRLGTWYLFFCVSLAYALTRVLSLLLLLLSYVLITHSPSFLTRRSVFFLIMHSFALSLALYVFFVPFLSIYVTLTTHQVTKNPPFCTPKKKKSHINALLPISFALAMAFLYYTNQKRIVLSIKAGRRVSFLPYFTDTYNSRIISSTCLAHGPWTSFGELGHLFPSLRTLSSSTASKV